MGNAWSQAKFTGSALKDHLKAGYAGRYEPPERKGNYPWTRSGVAPPRLERGEFGHEPVHKMPKDQADLQVHLGTERQRLRAGYSEAERQMRKQYKLDQRLHPDEPIRIDAIYRQLNPIRKLYRMPWDWAYTKMLPRLGIQWAHFFRVWTPKLFLFYGAGCCLWYHIKYSKGDWARNMKTYGENTPYVHPRYDEIEAMEPGIHRKAFATARWIHPDDKDRDHLTQWGTDWYHLWEQMVLNGDPGVSRRPW